MATGIARAVDNDHRAAVENAAGSYEHKWTSSAVCEKAMPSANDMEMKRETPLRIRRAVNQVATTGVNWRRPSREWWEEGRDGNGAVSEAGRRGDHDGRWRNGRRDAREA